MQECGAADRSDLAVAEESRQGNVAHVLAEHVRVMVRGTVEIGAAAHAGEQQSAGLSVY